MSLWSLGRLRPAAARRGLASAVVVVVGAAATGCGTGGGLGSFVGSGAHAVILLQWTRSGSHLTGQLREAMLAGAGLEQVSDRSALLTGTISGSRVTLSIGRGLGSLRHITGTLNGTEFDLRYRAEDGGVLDIPMHHGGGSVFDQAVGNLESQAILANEHS